MALLLMRHGPTQLNNADQSKDRIRGWLNVKLSRDGEHVAQQLASEVKHIPIHDLKSSDLSRAADTAKAVEDTTGVPMTTHVELRPWDLGTLAGQPTDKVMPIIKQLVDEPTKKAPGGESFDEFMKRFVPFVQPLLDDEKTSRRRDAYSQYQNA